MKIFSDKKYLPDGFPHCPLLFTFWGIPPSFGAYEMWARRFDRYLDVGRSVFELTNLEEAEAVVLPFDWRCIEEEDFFTRVSPVGPAAVPRARRLAEDLASIAADEGKVLCVFFVHDDATRRVPLTGCRVFRPSLLRTVRSPDEFAIPAWVRDELEASTNGEIPLRPKNKAPVIGFCGYAPRPPSARGRMKSNLRPVVNSLLASMGRGLPTTSGFQARSSALKLLSRSTALKCEFTIRDQWWAGAVTNEGANVALMRRAHKQYVANMIGSDYILCARGAGNYSYRLYETLCCGRIPIFINTDCVLPFEEWIDWKQYCVWVEERNLSQIADIVLDFHSRMTPRQFQELQRACRQLWVDWLSPHGFFANFHRYLG